MDAEILHCGHWYFSGDEERDRERRIRRAAFLLGAGYRSIQETPAELRSDAINHLLAIGIALPSRGAKGAAA